MCRGRQGHLLTQCLHSNRALIIQPLITLLLPLAEAGSPLLLTHPQAARAGAEWEHPHALGGVTSMSQTAELAQPPALHTSSVLSSRSRDTRGHRDLPVPCVCTPVLTLPGGASVRGGLPISLGIFRGMVSPREATLKCGVGFSPRIPSAWSRVSSSHLDPGQRYSPGGTAPARPPWPPDPNLILRPALNSITSPADTSPASPTSVLTPNSVWQLPVLRPAAGTSEGGHPCPGPWSVSVREGPGWHGHRVSTAGGAAGWPRAQLGEASA